MSAPFLRVLGDRERADLSNEWKNPTVDTNKYYMTVNLACECDESTFTGWNGPKQINDQRFIIGCAGEGL